MDLDQLNDEATPRFTPMATLESSFFLSSFSICKIITQFSISLITCIHLIMLGFWDYLQLDSYRPCCDRQNGCFSYSSERSPLLMFPCRQNRSDTNQTERNTRSVESSTIQQQQQQQQCRFLYMCERFDEVHRNKRPCFGEGGPQWDHSQQLTSQHICRQHAHKNVRTLWRVSRRPPNL